jgi:predicted regulator of Ras-like GTPase activity (Roadblock/LC7/MglB family)
MGVQMPYEEQLKEIAAACDALAATVTTRDGVTVASAIPNGASPETFSVMCATMMGAGLTAAGELGRPGPTRIVMESGDVRTVVLGIDKRHILAVVIPANRDPTDVEEAAEHSLGLAPVA